MPHDDDELPLQESVVPQHTPEPVEPEEALVALPNISLQPEELGIPTAVLSYATSGLCVAGVAREDKKQQAVARDWDRIGHCGSTVPFLGNCVTRGERVVVVRMSSMC